MSDLLKSIDKAQIEAGKEKAYKIEGWCVFKDRRPKITCQKKVN